MKQQFSDTRDQTAQAVVLKRERKKNKMSPMMSSVSDRSGFPSFGARRGNPDVAQKPPSV